jgi:hypothetical protein
MPRHPLLTACSRVGSYTFRSVERAVQACAFWTATLLPLGYVPLLLVAPSRFVTLGLFGKLVALNVVALVLGRGYAADHDED